MLFLQEKIKVFLFKIDIFRIKKRQGLNLQNGNDFINFNQITPG